METTRLYPKAGAVILFYLTYNWYSYFDLKRVIQIDRFINHVEDVGIL